MFCFCDDNCIIVTHQGIPSYALYTAESDLLEKFTDKWGADVFERRIHDAEAGDTNAQYTIAQLYYNGWGKSRNPTRALQWFVRAAEQDHVDAQFRAGTMYEAGEGATASKDAALNWYHKAAARGHVEASAMQARLKRPSAVSCLLVNCRVQALYDYQARNPNELSFREGQQIFLITSENDSWACGECMGATVRAPFVCNVAAI